MQRKPHHACSDNSAGERKTLVLLPEGSLENFNPQLYTPVPAWTPARFRFITGWLTFGGHHRTAAEPRGKLGGQRRRKSLYLHLRKCEVSVINISTPTRDLMPTM